MHDEISSTASAQYRNTFVPDCDCLAALCSGRNLQSLLAFESGHRDLATEGSLGNSDRDHAVQIVSFAHVERIFFHSQNDVQITRRAAEDSSFAFSLISNAR